MRLSQLPVLAFIFLSLAGCTSLTERGNEHYVLGEYRAAASLYEQALQKNSDDPVAKERLFRSRQKLIEERLIGVRQDRLSDNFEGAIEKLRGIIDDQARWQVSSTGPAFSTQIEELDYAFKWTEKQIQILLSEGKFLKANLLAKNNVKVFEVGSTRKPMSQLIAQVSSLGAQHCRKLSAMATGQYSNEFISRYCIYWGSQEKRDSRIPASPQSSSLAFGSVTLSGGIDGIPKELLATASEQVLEGMKDTPFYSAAANPLSVTVSGRYVANYQESPTTKIHSYTVQIPYQEEITVPYLVNVPHTTYQQQYNFATRSMQTIPITSYMLETRFRTEMVTKYQDEARSLAYPATDYRLVYILVGKLAFSVDGSRHEFPINEQYSKTDYY
ncbi:MAG: tetratricopeptide repeat protein, partial [Proteobacteria bacterium]